MRARDTPRGRTCCSSINAPQVDEEQQPAGKRMEETIGSGRADQCDATPVPATRMALVENRER